MLLVKVEWESSQEMFAPNVVIKIACLSIQVRTKIKSRKS